MLTVKAHLCNYQKFKQVIISDLFFIIFMSSKNELDMKKMKINIIVLLFFICYPFFSDARVIYSDTKDVYGATPNIRTYLDTLSQNLMAYHNVDTYVKKIENGVVYLEMEKYNEEQKKYISDFIDRWVDDSVLTIKNDEKVGNYDYFSGNKWDYRDEEITDVGDTEEIEDLKITDVSLQPMIKPSFDETIFNENNETTNKRNEVADSLSKLIFTTRDEGFVLSGQRVSIAELTVSSDSDSLNSNLYNGNVYVLYDSGQLKEEFQVKNGVLNGQYLKFLSAGPDFDNNNYQDTLKIQSLLSDLDTINTFISKLRQDSVREEQISNNIKYNELGVKKFYRYAEKYRKGKLKKEKLNTYNRYLKSTERLRQSIKRLKDSYWRIDNLGLQLVEERNKPIYKNWLEESFSYIMGNQTGIHKQFDYNSFNGESLQSRVDTDKTMRAALALEEELIDGVRNGSFKRICEGRNCSFEGFEDLPLSDDYDSYTIEGTFKDNKKNGTFTYTRSSHHGSYIVKEIYTYSNDVKNGDYKKYARDLVLAEGQYSIGMKTGTWKDYKSGDLTKEYNFIKDTLDGPYKEYSENVVVKEGQYSNGLMNGEWKYNITIYHYNMKSMRGRVEETYLNGKLNGNYKKYEGDVVVEEGKYLDGLMDGEWIFRHSNGNLKGKCKYIKGDGKYKQYYDSGELEWTVYYNQGKRDRYRKTSRFYKNGNIWYEGYAGDGETEWYGEFKKYHENGNLMEISNYDMSGNGRILSTKKYDSNGKEIIEKTNDYASSYKSDYYRKEVCSGGKVTSRWEEYKDNRHKIELRVKMICPYCSRESSVTNIWFRGDRDECDEREYECSPFGGCGKKYILKPCLIKHLDERDNF